LISLSVPSSHLARKFPKIFFLCLSPLKGIHLPHQMSSRECLTSSTKSVLGKLRWIVTIFADLALHKSKYARRAVHGKQGEVRNRLSNLAPSEGPNVVTNKPIDQSLDSLVLTQQLGLDCPYHGPILRLQVIQDNPKREIYPLNRFMCHSPGDSQHFLFDRTMDKFRYSKVAHALM